MFLSTGILIRFSPRNFPKRNPGPNFVTGGSLIWAVLNLRVLDPSWFFEQSKGVIFFCEAATQLRKAIRFKAH
jgi:hypothetical protein